jgi:putative sigma-54 modulation protein
VRTSVKARNMELSPRLRATIDRKLRRLDRISHPEAEATVELIANASHANNASHAVEIILVNNGSVLRSVSTGPTPIAALDTVLDKLERQAVRHKERPRSVRERVSGEPQEVLAREAVGTVDPLVPSSRRAPQVSRTKRFDMVPMFEEDAITRMEELGHAFFFFLDAETDELAVLYRRTDGTYGLIEPVVGRGRHR